MATDKKAKAVVEALLKQKGLSYEEWLNQKHLEYIMKNADTMLSALKVKGEN